MNITAENSGSLLTDVSSLDFWLSHPLRIVLIFIIAIGLNILAKSLINKVTAGIARGTRARVVSKKNSPNDHDEWVEDAATARKRQAQRAQTVGSVLRSVVTIVIWTIAILMIISELGFNIAPVIASAGIAGVALSFGAQSLVKDYLAGISIVAEDQLGIGDVVDLGEASGTVESVGLRVTQVRDVEGTLWHVRNGEILRVGNKSQGWARTIVDVPVPYNSNIEEVTDLLLHAARRVKKETEIGRSIRGKPEVWGIEEMTGEYLTLRIAVRTAPLQQWDVARILRIYVKEALDHDGLRIPLMNQSVIHGTQSMPIVSAKATASSPESGHGGSSSHGSSAT